MGLIRSAMQRQHAEVFAGYLEALQSANVEEAQAVEVDLMKRQLSLSLSKTPDERLVLIADYYEALRAAGIPAGEVGIAWFQLLGAMRRNEEASNVLRRVVSENQNDPAVREFVYMLNMRMEQMRQAGAGGANRLHCRLVSSGGRQSRQGRRRRERRAGLFVDS